MPIPSLLLDDGKFKSTVLNILGAVASGMIGVGVSSCAGPACPEHMAIAAYVSAFQQYMRAMADTVALTISLKAVEGPQDQSSLQLDWEAGGDQIRAVQGGLSRMILPYATALHRVPGAFSVKAEFGTGRKICANIS